MDIACVRPQRKPYFNGSIGFIGSTVPSVVPLMDNPVDSSAVQFRRYDKQMDVFHLSISRACTIQTQLNAHPCGTARPDPRQWPMNMVRKKGGPNRMYLQTFGKLFWSARLGSTFGSDPAPEDMQNLFDSRRDRKLLERVFTPGAVNEVPGCRRPSFAYLRAHLAYRGPMFACSLELANAMAFKHCEDACFF